MKKMLKKIERWAKNKKNRKMLFVILGAVMLYFYAREKQRSQSGGYSDLSKPKPGTGTQTGGSAGAFQPYTPGNGAITPKMAAFSDPDHINMQWSGGPNNWVFTDAAITPPAPGYSVRYHINTGETIITKNRLEGYRWESNFPINFEKLIIKDGVDDYYYYGTTDRGLQRESDGQVFPGNVTAAKQTFYFNRS